MYRSNPTSPLPASILASGASPGWWLSIRLSAAVLGLLLAGSAGADAMRCGHKVVRDGDTQMMVRDLCGEPSDVQIRSILRRPSIWRNGRRFYLGDAVVEVPVEFWTYNFGPYKLMRRVKFVDGLIEEIETLGHGYHPPAK